MVVRPLACLSGCRDGFGEIGRPAPHRPVSGRQVDQFEVAQAGYLGEHRVPAAGQLEQLGRRQRARDDRGGHIQSLLVAQVQAVAGHVAGNRHRAAAECRKPLIVEAVQAGPAGGELVPGWQRDGLDVVAEGDNVLLTPAQLLLAADENGGGEIVRKLGKSGTDDVGVVLAVVGDGFVED